MVYSILSSVGLGQYWMHSKWEINVMNTNYTGKFHVSIQRCWTMKINAPHFAFLVTWCTQPACMTWEIGVECSPLWHWPRDNRNGIGARRPKPYVSYNLAKLLMDSMSIHWEECILFLLHTLGNYVPVFYSIIWKNAGISLRFPTNSLFCHAL